MNKNPCAQGCSGEASSCGTGKTGSCCGAGKKIGSCAPGGKKTCCGGETLMHRLNNIHGPLLKQNQYGAPN
jgi:hypothetical protein